MLSSSSSVSNSSSSTNVSTPSSAEIKSTDILEARKNFFRRVTTNTHYTEDPTSEFEASTLESFGGENFRSFFERNEVYNLGIILTEAILFRDVYLPLSAITVRHYPAAGNCYLVRTQYQHVMARNSAEYQNKLHFQLSLEAFTHLPFAAGRMFTLLDCVSKGEEQVSQYFDAGDYLSVDKFYEEIWETVLLHALRPREFYHRHAELSVTDEKLQISLKKTIDEIITDLYENVFATSEFIAHYKDVFSTNTCGPVPRALQILEAEGMSLGFADQARLLPKNSLNRLLYKLGIVSTESSNTSSSSTLPSIASANTSTSSGSATTSGNVSVANPSIQLPKLDPSSNNTATTMVPSTSTSANVSSSSTSLPLLTSVSGNTLVTTTSSAASKPPPWHQSKNIPSIASPYTMRQLRTMAARNVIAEHRRTAAQGLLEYEQAAMAQNRSRPSPAKSRNPLLQSSSIYASGSFPRAISSSLSSSTTSSSSTTIGPGVKRASSTTNPTPSDKAPAKTFGK